jgi:hypothetical protein
MCQLGDCIENWECICSCIHIVEFKKKKKPIVLILLLHTEGQAVPVHTMKAYGAIGI